MAIRYEDAPENVTILLRRVMSEHFPELVNAKIKILFDLKKKMAGGKLVLGRIQKTSEILRHFTIDDADSEEGYDYIIYLDKMAYDNIGDEDRIRLLRHELRHAIVNIEARGNPYGLIGHDIEDFEEEIRLNSDDMSWARRVAEMTLSLYEED